jgi:hypothetical protein
MKIKNIETGCNIGATICLIKLQTFVPYQTHTIQFEFIGAFIKTQKRSKK